MGWVDSGVWGGWIVVLVGGWCGCVGDGVWGGWMVVLVGVWVGG